MGIIGIVDKFTWRGKKMNKSNYYVVKRKNKALCEYALFVADTIDFNNYDCISWEVSSTDDIKDASKFRLSIDAVKLISATELNVEDWEVVPYVEDDEMSAEVNKNRGGFYSIEVGDVSDLSEADKLQRKLPPISVTLYGMFGFFECKHCSNAVCVEDIKCESCGGKI